MYIHILIYIYIYILTYLRTPWRTHAVKALVLAGDAPQMCQVESRLSREEPWSTPGHVNYTTWGCNQILCIS